MWRIKLGAGKCYGIDLSEAKYKQSFGWQEKPLCEVLCEES